MKSNSLITAGLLAVGLISATNAFAVNGTLVTITGSTAFRAVTYTACTTPGAVFASQASGAPADPIDLLGAGNGAADVVFRGYLKNGDGTYTLYDLDAEWTGSEAGIASVCQNTTLLNDTPAFNGPPPLGPGGPGTSAMPGVPPAYLDPSSNYSTHTAAGAIPTDLALADSSQAVSLTKKVTGTATDLVPYGVVGIVPFMWLKGHNTAPATPSWGHIVNMTHPAAHLSLSGPQFPRLYTGNSSAIDPDSDAVVVCGRNKGSGTRVNQLLDSAYGLTTPVDQFTVFSHYTGAGVLTFGSIAAYGDGDIQEIGNDGFDSGGSVSKVLQCDGKGSAVIFIGFLGIPDAIGLPIHTGGAVAGGAVPLTLDGVTESNGAIENAQYTAWGHENLYGKHGQLATDAGGKIGTALQSGIPTALGTLGWGVVAATQDAGIPTSLMHADKASGGDTGYPAPQ